MELKPKECLRFDHGKANWTLLPFDALQEVVRVLDYGADKYGPHNWVYGLSYSRGIAATFRHLTKWWQGEDIDSESGVNHLAHAICNLLFVLAFVCQNRHELDDRPRVGVKHQA